jgi:HAD superfamily hydrolase (TIGR01509 family)
MSTIQAVIFDLGGTLVDWPDWDTAAEDRWASAHDYYRAQAGGAGPSRGDFVAAMRSAELEHWKRVEQEYWSGPPNSLVAQGFAKLGYEAAELDQMLVLDGYARAVSGWAVVYPDSRATLLELRARGLALGLLSNTWWAAAWHNADLAAHGLDALLDVAVYTSDLPHSKPHPLAFAEVTGRLGVEPEACVMIGDRPIDDVQGALNAGMRAVFKTNRAPRPVPHGIVPTATIENLGELPPLIAGWNVSSGS